MKNSISRLRKGFSMMKFDRYLSSIVKCIKETAFCSLQTIYYEGLRNGLENGKYLSFAQWFYEFYEDYIDE